MEIVAEKTLQAIENQIMSDNGKRFKELEQQILLVRPEDSFLIARAMQEGAKHLASFYLIRFRCT